MASETTRARDQKTGMMMTISYVVLLIVNALVIWFAHTWYPNNVVLGTMSISVPWAVALSAGALALFDTLLLPFFHEWEIRRDKMLSSPEWMAGYLVLNFVGLWLISRVSEIFGMGLSSWIVVLILAVVLDVVQGLGMMALEKVRK